MLNKRYSVLALFLIGTISAQETVER